MMVSMHAVMGEQSDHRNHRAGFCLSSRGVERSPIRRGCCWRTGNSPSSSRSHALLDTLVSNHALMRAANTSDSFQDQQFQE
ncbi:hypothetical protein SAMN05216404_11821 [Nitrosospira multiformis]|uniref:Uncharacterized protein n=1 Tax=Nitrosospira multiformis TaxID=1231 RepID=A0A1H8NYG2_9PROT|nr:hypothetical protein SAMN05216404_11821 [Nitrosospira multiformis]